jgi:heme-degrading monooxygenase HmoA
MIARFWHGRTRTVDAAEYRRYVTDTGISGLLATPGNSGCQIWQQEDGDITHIIVISWWDGYESIKAFAGEDITNARYYEEDKKYLLEMEPSVIHYECYDFGKPESEL